MKPLVRCPHCGLYHQTNLEYCPNTGLPIYTTTSPEPPPKKNRTLLWLALIAGLLLIAGCVLGSVFLIPRLLDGELIPKSPVPVIVPSITLEPLQTRLAESQPSTPTVTQPENTQEPAMGTVEIPPSATPETWDACPGYEVRSRMQVGMQAQIALDPPLPNRVRETPSALAKIAGFIDPGGKLEILEGPVCEEGWIWWRVKELDSDLTGWTAEGDTSGYWLVPLP